VARGIISFPREPNLIEAGDRGKNFSNKVVNCFIICYTRIMTNKNLILLNELMVCIEEQLGEKLEWQIHPERKQVLLDHKTLTVIYDTLLQKGKTQ
jgi:hypothetical protein